MKSQMVNEQNIEEQANIKECDPKAEKKIRKWMPNCTVIGYMMLAILFYATPVHAAGEASSIVTNAFQVIYDIIAAIVSSIGSLFLLWGIFEWGQSLNQHDGGAQSIAFKRIAAGLITVIAPNLIPLITASIQ